MARDAEAQQAAEHAAGDAAGSRPDQGRPDGTARQERTDRRDGGQAEPRQRPAGDGAGHQAARRAGASRVAVFFDQHRLAGRIAPREADLITVKSCVAKLLDGTLGGVAVVEGADDDRVLCIHGGSSWGRAEPPLERAVGVLTPQQPCHPAIIGFSCPD